MSTRKLRKANDDRENGSKSNPITVNPLDSLQRSLHKTTVNGKIHYSHKPQQLNERQKRGTVSLTDMSVCKAMGLVSLNLMQPS